MAEAIDYFLIQDLLHRDSDALDRGDFARVGETEPSVKAGTAGFGPALTKWTRIFPDTENPEWRFTERRERVGQTGDLSAHLLRPFEGPTGE